MTDNPHLTSMRKPEDIDAALRPKTLAEFIGQQAARENLRVFIEAAKSRGDALEGGRRGDAPGHRLRLRNDRDPRAEPGQQHPPLGAHPPRLPKVMSSAVSASNTRCRSKEPSRAVSPPTLHANCRPAPLKMPVSPT